MIFWNWDNPFTLLYCCIWNFCEYFNINLGRFAPHVFGGALGRKGHKKDE